jgi:hypothetical protein
VAWRCPAGDDDPVDLSDNTRVALEGFCDGGKGAKAQDGDLGRSGFDPIDDQFVAREQMLSFDRGKSEISQTVGSVQFASVAYRSVIGIGSDADAWVAWWIEFFQESQDISRALLGFDISRGGRHGEHIESRVEQGDRESQSVINSRIAVDNDFSSHGFAFVFLACA